MKRIFLFLIFLAAQHFTNAQCVASFIISPGEMPNDNGIFVFMNTSTPSTNVTYIWNFGDGSTSNVISPTHQFTSEGVFEVCLTMIAYSNNEPLCTNVFCSPVTVDLPEGGCDLGEFPLAVNVTTCCANAINNFLVYTIFDSNNNAVLFDGIEVSGTPGSFQNIHCLPPGCYSVQMDYSDMMAMLEETESIVFSSPNMTDYTVTDTWGNLPWQFTFCIESSLPVCPNELVYDQPACGTYIFHLNDFPDQGNIVWNFGDGSMAGNTNNQTHTFDTPGVYEVCATAYTAECPQGAEVCTIVEVVDCNTSNCPTNIVGSTIDCDTYLFALSPVFNEGVAVWDFGDGSATSFGLTADHTFAENGTYIVTVQYVGPTCPNVTILVYTVLVNCPDGNDCPDQIYATPAATCNTWNFEIGSFVQGANVVWNFDDGTGQIVGGQFMPHTFNTPGTYQVCAYFASPLCTEGVQLCTVLSDNYSTIKC
jgi:PKD domain